MNIPIGEDGLPLVDPTGARIDLPQDERRRHHREAYNRDVAVRRAAMAAEGVLNAEDVEMDMVRGNNLRMLKLPEQRVRNSQPKRTMGGKKKRRRTKSMKNKSKRKTKRNMKRRRTKSRKQKK